jgi:autotransporter translocation and assembly factor TamB
MRWIRRILQVVALVGTIMVGVVAIALIVSQTPWFRDWLRRYVVRESKQYLNGELTIGRIGGNLLFGVDISDVAVDVSGERIVAVKTLVVDYSVFDFISKGIVLDDIKLQAPVLRVERDGNGWNLGRLVKKQEREADREGPRRPISLPSIEIADASIYIDDRHGSNGYNLPARIDDLDVKASYEYAPVHYSVGIDRISFRTSSPQLTLSELTGKLAVRDDNLYVESMSIRTGESSLTIDGVIEHYLATPVVKVTTTGQASLPEIARVIPAAAGYALHPSFDVRAEGPADKLALTLDVKSEAGHVRGEVTADVKAPDFAVRGGVDLERLNLAPILKNPRQRSDLTGHAELDLRMASSPASAPVLDRLRGTYSFQGPQVVAAGYSASNVRVSGAFEKGRIKLDGRAAAYGGTATAQGFIAPPSGGRPLALDLRGAANNVDLRKLPASIGVPKLATDLSVAEYHVSGAGRAISATAQLKESTVEGATIAAGTVAEFKTGADGVAYSSRGSAANLNLQRIGRALEIAALDKPAYDGRLNADFDVTGTVPPATAGANESRVKTMTLDATGTVRDSAIMGGSLPQMAFEAHLANGSLRAHADGRFEGFDPAALSGRKEVAGRVTGTVNATATLADVTAPLTADTIEANGQLTLEKSTVGGLQIDAAAIDGKYAAKVGDLTKLQVTGPDLKVDASGRVALDRTSASNLKYHVEATDLAELSKLIGQDGVSGAVVLDGTVSGNAASLQTTGLLDGSNVAYNGNKALDLNSKYTVSVPELTFKDAKVEAETTATFVAAAGLEISSLTATATYEKQQIQFTTNIKEKTRELDATGSVILHPDHQEIHLPQLAIRTQGFEWRTAPGSEATIQYGKSELVLKDVKLVSGDQALDVSGTLAMGEKSKAAGAGNKIVARARNVDLQQLETLLLQNRGFTGRLNADATISGTSSAPAVDGHVEVRNGTFKTYKYESLVADVDYAGTRLDLDATLQQSATESITAKGTVPTTLFQRSTGEGHVAAAGEDQIDLQIQSTALNLGVVQGFTNQVTNVTGTLQADVKVTGSGHDPHLDGFIDIKGGAFGIPAGGVSYSGLDTRIELDPDRVRLQKFTILDEHKQPLHLSGELAVHERTVGDVNISIESDNFEIIDNELGDVGIDSSLKITGELRRPRITGEVKLEAARLEVDQILQLFYDPYSVESLPDVVSAERTVEGTGSAEDAAKQALQRAEVSAAPPGAEAAAAAPAPAPTGAFEPVTLDVHLVIPDNLVLRGKKLRPSGPTGASLGDMNITVGGDLRIRKEPGAPVTLLGPVETVRGTYEFQGRRFDLVRGGTLRFIGEPQINPLLDISATRIIPNTGVEARVRVTGTVKTPQLSLSSNPPLDESDILALIVFNRPVNELGTGERASLAATAGGIATGFLAAPLGESIGRALDLDLFEITTTTDEGELGAGLTVGQQIGERAFVKLRQQFGERNITEFLFEYQLARFLRVQLNGAPETSGSANRIGERRIERAGVDLIFFFSY